MNEELHELLTGEKLEKNNYSIGPDVGSGRRTPMGGRGTIVKKIPTIEEMCLKLLIDKKHISLLEVKTYADEHDLEYGYDFTYDEESVPEWPIVFVNHAFDHLKQSIGNDADFLRENINLESFVRNLLAAIKHPNNYGDNLDIKDFFESEISFDTERNIRYGARAGAASDYYKHTFGLIYNINYEMSLSQKHFNGKPNGLYKPFGLYYTNKKQLPQDVNYYGKELPHIKATSLILHYLNPESKRPPQIAVNNSIEDFNPFRKQFDVISLKFDNCLDIFSLDSNEFLIQNIDNGMDWLTDEGIFITEVPDQFFYDAELYANIRHKLFKNQNIRAIYNNRDGYNDHWIFVLSKVKNDFIDYYKTNCDHYELDTEIERVIQENNPIRINYESIGSKYMQNSVTPFWRFQFNPRKRLGRFLKPCDTVGTDEEKHAIVFTSEDFVNQVSGTILDVSILKKRSTKDRYLRAISEPSILFYFDTKNQKPNALFYYPKKGKTIYVSYSVDVFHIRKQIKKRFNPIAFLDRFLVDMAKPEVIEQLNKEVTDQELLFFESSYKLENSESEDFFMEINDKWEKIRKRDQTMINRQLSEKVGQFKHLFNNALFQLSNDFNDLNDLVTQLPMDKIKSTRTDGQNSYLEVIESVDTNLKSLGKLINDFNYSYVPNPRDLFTHFDFLEYFKQLSESYISNKLGHSFDYEFILAQKDTELKSAVVFANQAEIDIVIKNLVDNIRKYSRSHLEKPRVLIFLATQDNYVKLYFANQIDRNNKTPSKSKGQGFKHIEEIMKSHSGYFKKYSDYTEYFCASIALPLD